MDRNSYPTGKTGKMPMGMPSNKIPGSGARGDSIVKPAVPDQHPRSAGHKADGAATMVPGASIGKRKIPS